MQTERVTFTFTTNPSHPPISVVKNEQGSCELLINLNQRRWILKNRRDIVTIFCKSLHSIIDDLIDDMAEEIDE